MTNQMNLDVEVEVKKVTRSIEIPFTVTEFAEMGKDGGRLAAERDDHKEKAKQCQKALDQVLAKIEKGKKQEDVLCEMKLFYATRTVQVFHGEEMIEERAMVEEEFQKDIQDYIPRKEDDFETKVMSAEEAKADLEGVMRDEKNGIKENSAFSEVPAL